MRVKDFEVWITDNKDVRLAEHQVVIDSSTAVCYLESKMNQEFIIHWCDARAIRNTGMAIDSFIDGTRVDNAFQYPESLPGRCAYVRTSPTTAQPFIFSAPTLVDEHTSGVCTKAEILEMLASIKIRCFRANFVARSENEGIIFKDELTDRKLNEKSKKGHIANVVKLGQAKQVPTSNNIRVSYVDSITGPPFSEFIFRYMPKEMLEARDIIPIERPPAVESTPEAKAEKRQRDDDELARLRAENERLRKRVKVEVQKNGGAGPIDLDEDGDVKPKVEKTVDYKTSKDQDGKTVIELD